MNAKQNLSLFLRRTGLMKTSDFLRFLWIRWRNRKANRTFRREHPEVVLPPDYLMYESFMLDYSRYYLNGKKTAEWLTGLVQQQKDLKGASILDWGCGPARVIRHLPGILPDAVLYGTDYNRRSIAWCSNTFSAIWFHTNDLMPGFVYEKEMFDLVYGISIFTHLSEEGHQAWLKELSRVLKPGGILFLTLHGSGFRDKLTPRELTDFDAGQLVVRGQVSEGHRTFAAFHPAAWVKAWSAGMTLAMHIPGGPGEQDVWMLRK
jgi:SAM-dependent methyltransferase